MKTRTNPPTPLPAAIVARLKQRGRTQAIVDPRHGSRDFIGAARSHFGSRVARPASWAVASRHCGQPSAGLPAGPAIRFIRGPSGDAVDGSGRVDVLDVLALARAHAGDRSARAIEELGYRNRSAQRRRSRPIVRRTATTWLLAALFATATPACGRNPSSVRGSPSSTYTWTATPPSLHGSSSCANVGALMQVVGIEGGEGQGFHEPPFYDRRAVAQGNSDRVIVASYSLTTPPQLPSAAYGSRGAAACSGEAAPDYDLRLIAAGTADGHVIDAKISLRDRGR